MLDPRLNLLADPWSDSLAAKQLHSIILTPPCLTVGLAFLGSKASFQNILKVVAAKQLNFCFIWPHKFPPEGFFYVQVISSKLQLSFKSVWSKGYFLARPPLSAKHTTLWWFLVDSLLSWPDFSQQQVIFVVCRWGVCFLPDGGSDTTVPFTLYLQTVAVQLVLGPVTAFKWFQVTFLTCSNP